MGFQKEISELGTLGVWGLAFGGFVLLLHLLVFVRLLLVGITSIAATWKSSREPKFRWVENHVRINRGG